MPSDLLEEVALKLVEVIKIAIQVDYKIALSWAERFQDPQLEAAEIETRHVAAYPNGGKMEASTSGKGNISL